MTRLGEIPTVRIGHRILVPVGALAEQLSVPVEWLAERLAELQG